MLLTIIGSRAAVPHDSDDSNRVLGILLTTISPHHQERELVAQIVALLPNVLYAVYTGFLLSPIPSFTVLLSAHSAPSTVFLPIPPT
jgi:hypothetical protein